MMSAFDVPTEKYGEKKGKRRDTQTQKPTWTNANVHHCQ